MKLVSSAGSLAQAALYTAGVVAGTVKYCPSMGVPLSCHNTTAVTDTCCTPVPGGLLLQTQFWDTLSTGASVVGPNNSFTVHGLWPDNCDGTYEQYCDNSRAYQNITQIIQAAGATDLLAFMMTYWTDYQGQQESFWEHEWAKHGTCISTFDTDCYTNYTPQQEVVDYFNATVQLYKTLNSYKFLTDAGIVPSFTANYTLTQVMAALRKPRGVNAYISCSSGQLDQVWYYFNVYGSVQTGAFVPTAPVGSQYSCPATFQWLPKGVNPNPAPSSTSTSSTKIVTSTTTSSTSTTTPVPFIGRGTMPVNPVGGAANGCIISAGTWYTTGTCATFTGTAASLGPSTFTLVSSKGNCAVAGGLFTCAASNTKPTVFTAINGLLTYNGKTTFYTNAVPTGIVQGVVETTSDAVAFEIKWKSS